MMDTAGGAHVSGSGASGSHSSGLSPNVASMTVMPPLNPLPAFGFGGAPAAHGGPVYPAQPLSTTGCSPLYLPPPPAGVVGPVPYPSAVSSPPHSLVAAHCGSPYPPALQSPGGPGSGLYASGSAASGILANGSASKLLIGRHMCAICEDAASGKHYGVYSCEGCKGFFKRTVRKDLRYTCRENNNCIVDKRQRNRCQACRYQRCLQTGMKREAVQEERLGAEKGEMEAESTTAGGEILIDSILSAEMRNDSNSDSVQTVEDIDAMPVYSWNSVCSQLSHMLVDWALAVPHFTELSSDDQLMILKAGWNELLISSFAHRSVTLNNCLALTASLRLGQGPAADHFGLSPIYDRILTDLVLKMRTMCVDRFELGCLRIIVLFNPDAKGLQMTAHVESLREKVYVTLEEYCRRQYADDPGRFAKLLLRLPALRSIGLKCPSYLFLSQLCQAEGSSPETYINLLLKGIYTS